MINKNHPKYQEYWEKAMLIADEGEKEVEEERKTTPLQKDGPETAIRKRTWAKIKALQIEYSFLFVEDNQSEGDE